MNTNQTKSDLDTQSPSNLPTKIKAMNTFIELIGDSNKNIKKMFLPIAAVLCIGLLSLFRIIDALLFLVFCGGIYFLFSIIGYFISSKQRQIRQLYRYANALEDTEYMSVHELAQIISEDEETVEHNIQCIINNNWLKDVSYDQATQMIHTLNVKKHEVQQEENSEEKNEVKHEEKHEIKCEVKHDEKCKIKREVNHEVKFEKNINIDQIRKYSKKFAKLADLSNTQHIEEKLNENTIDSRLINTDEMEAFTTKINQYLLDTRTLSSQSQDDQIKQECEQIHWILTKIQNYIIENIEDVDKSRRITNDYLPTALHIFNNYKSLETNTLKQFNEALSQFYEEIYQDTSIDIQTNISLLYALMEQDGIEKPLK